MNKIPLAMIAGSLVLTANLALSEDKNAFDERMSGGKTTVFDTSTNAFSLPAKNLGILRRDNFFIGNAFFKQPWVSAPASTSARDGLGPIFNANTCQGCHIKDGKGHPPLEEGEGFISTLVRLSVPATDSDADKQALLSNGSVPDPVYGGQLQPKGAKGVKAEATPRLEYQEINGQFADGEKYTLIKPSLILDDPNYGDFHKELMTSVRVAPVMIGMGLLEAIPEADILANVVPEDEAKKGISGKANKVWDVKQEKTVLGRFGWKANQPNVEQQVAGAFNGDLGITSNLFPKDECTPAQTDCLAAPHGGDPEVNDEILDKVVFYSSTLAVPARRNMKDPQVMQGQRLFAQADCTSCHTPQFTTGELEKFPELSNQTITPYTDLLLHDMGEGLADGRPDFLATGKEWRTAPLWGIGMIEKVNGHTRFLHDGRARNLQEAVLWHGGEAEAAKQAFVSMNKDDRAALIAFLNSL